MTVLPATDEVRFTIAYDGPALANGRMALLDLAPAMLSTARMVEDGVRVLYGPTAAVKIEVNADFRRGSFAFDVFARPELAQRTHDVLSGLTMEEVNYVLTWLGLLGGGGVLSLIKWLRSRKVKAVEKSARNDHTRVILHDGDSITVHANVANLTFNQAIREDVEGIMKPLRSPGITEFRSGPPDQPSVVIRESDAPHFDPPPPPQRELQDKVTVEVVEVIAPTFREGNKWRFAQGDTSFFAAVLDEDFLRRVARHMYTFGTGDALRVELRTRVTQGPNGLSALREVVRVIEYIPAPTLPDLFAATQVDLFSPRRPAPDPSEPTDE